MVNDGKKMLCGLAETARIGFFPQGEDVTAMPFSELMNQHHGMCLGIGLPCKECEMLSISW